MKNSSRAPGRRIRRLLFAAAALAVTAALPQPARAQTDWEKYETRTVEHLREYLRLDTSNPPGNERRAAEFFCEVFSRENIECQVFEIAPGRANAYARLRGDGSRRPVILLNHTDEIGRASCRERVYVLV